MRKLTEEANQMLNLIGAAMYARPDIDQFYARRSFRRILQLICGSGQTDCDSAVYITTPEGRQLNEAASMYIRLTMQQPDPADFEPKGCMSAYKEWYGTILLAASGWQQEYEMQK